jgi:hypothetical protein
LISPVTCRTSRSCSTNPSIRASRNCAAMVERPCHTFVPIVRQQFSFSPAGATHVTGHRPVRQPFDARRIPARGAPAAVLFSVDGPIVPTCGVHRRSASVVVSDVLCAWHTVPTGQDLYKLFLRHDTSSLC